MAALPEELDPKEALSGDEEEGGVMGIEGQPGQQGVEGDVVGQAQAALGWRWVRQGDGLPEHVGGGGGEQDEEGVHAGFVGVPDLQGVNGRYQGHENA